jgi:hypothetical protein
VALISSNCTNITRQCRYWLDKGRVSSVSLMFKLACPSCLRFPGGGRILSLRLSTNDSETDEEVGNVKDEIDVSDAETYFKGLSTYFHCSRQFQKSNYIVKSLYNNVISSSTYWITGVFEMDGLLSGLGSPSSSISQSASRTFQFPALFMSDF